MPWYRFIDENEKFQLYAEGMLCFNCDHKAHCGRPCDFEADIKCDCLECECLNCKKRIGPIDV